MHLHSPPTPYFYCSSLTAVHETCLVYFDYALSIRLFVATEGDETIQFRRVEFSYQFYTCFTTNSFARSFNIFFALWICGISDSCFVPCMLAALVLRVRVGVGAIFDLTHQPKKCIPRKVKYTCWSGCIYWMNAVGGLCPVTSGALCF